MAQLTGKLVADFDSFYSAVQKAEASLKSFESGSGKVTASLNKMVDSFSGRTIIQQATQMTKAVNDLGGVTQLTASEQKKLNDTLTEALAKFKALGQQAPADMVELARATKQAATETGGLSVKMVAVGAAIGTFVGNIATAALDKFVGGIKAAAMALPEIAMQGAAVADVTANFDHMTESAGRLGSTLLGALRTGTHNTIDDFELMKVANQDLAAGLNLTDQEFNDMATGAFALAQKSATDVGTALEVMNEAMVKGQPKSLAALTGKIDLAEAEEKYAEKLDGTAKQLDADQKLYADRQAILNAVRATTGRLGEQLDGLDEKVAQAQVAWRNFRNELGRSIAESPVIATAFDGIKKALVDAFGGNQERAVRRITTAINEMAIAAVNASATIVGTAGNAAKALLEVVRTYNAIAAGADVVRLATLKMTESFIVNWQIPTGIPGAGNRLLQNQMEQKEIQKAMADRAAWDLELTRKEAALDDVVRKTGESIKKVAADMRDAAAGADAFVGPLENQAVAMTAVNAAGKGTSTVLKQSEESIKAAKKAAEDYATSLANVLAVQRGYAGVLEELSGSTVEAIRYYIEQGAEVADLARMYGVAERQVKAIQAAMKLEADAFKESTAAIEDHRKELADVQGAISKGLAPVAESLGQVYEGTRKAIVDSTVALKENALFGLVPVAQAERDAEERMKAFQAELKADQIKAFDTALDQLAASFAQLAQISDGAFGNVARDIGEIIGALKLARDAAATFGKGLETFRQGNRIGGVTGMVAGAASGVAAMAQATEGGGAKGILGGIATGAALGSIVPVFGTAVGAAIGGIVGIVRAMKGVSEEVKKARGDVADFEKQWKSTSEMIGAVGQAYATLGYTGEQAQADIQAMWDAEAKGPAATQAEIAKLQTILDAADRQNKAVAAGMESIGTAASAAFGVITPAIAAQIGKLREMVGLTDEQKAALDRLTSSGPDFAGLTKMAEGYGISLEQLGPSFQQANLSQSAQKVYSDFELLMGAGADVNGVMVGMSDEINGMLQNAMKYGLKMPEAMRPLLEQMAKNGLLADENGQKIKDLTGINFEDKPLATSLDDLNTTIGDLIATLRDVPGALDKINTTKLEDKTFNITAHWDTSGNFIDENGVVHPGGLATGGYVTAAGIQQFAGGGRVLPFRPRGTDTVPAMLTPGEMVLTRDQQQRILNGGGGGVVNISINGGTYDTPASRQRLADQVGKAVMEQIRRQTRLNGAA